LEALIYLLFITIMFINYLIFRFQEHLKYRSLITYIFICYHFIFISTLIITF